MCSSPERERERAGAARTCHRREQRPFQFALADPASPAEPALGRPLDELKLVLVSALLAHAAASVRAGRDVAQPRDSDGRGAAAVPPVGIRAACQARRRQAPRAQLRARRWGRDALVGHGASPSTSWAAGPARSIARRSSAAALGSPPRVFCSAAASPSPSTPGICRRTRRRTSRAPSSAPSASSKRAGQRRPSTISSRAPVAPRGASFRTSRSRASDPLDRELQSLGRGRRPSPNLDLYPDTIDLDARQHPFPYRHARRFTAMLIETSIYLRALLQDFVIAGGRIVVRELPDRKALVAFDEPVIFNCTGLGARALLGDEELMPAKGQVTFLLRSPRSTTSPGRPPASTCSPQRRHPARRHVRARQLVQRRRPGEVVVSPRWEADSTSSADLMAQRTKTRREPLENAYARPSSRRNHWARSGTQSLHEQTPGANA